MIKRLARGAFIFFLSAVMIFENFALVDAADDAATTYQGYTWTRINSQTELENFYQEDKYGKRHKLYYDYGGGVTSTNENAWFRCLIVYSNDRYFVSGSGTCNDGESYSGRAISATYGIKVNEETFTTRTGLETPYIKYSGTDSRNGNCGMFYIRYANSDNSLSSQSMCLNMSWYGVHHHAAAYGMYKTKNINDNGGCGDGCRYCTHGDVYDRSWSCSNCTHLQHHIQFGRTYTECFSGSGLTDDQARAVYEAYKYYWNSNYYNIDSKGILNYVQKNYKDKSGYDVTIFDNKDFKLSNYRSYCSNYSDACSYVSEGTARIFFDIEGVCDRNWEYDDWDYEIDITKGDGGSDHEFKIFIGVPRAISLVSKTLALEPGSLTVFEEENIASNVRITVPTNATLVIRGTVYNDANIFINGGTLIIEGTLDTNSTAKTGYTTLNDTLSAQAADVAVGTQVAVLPGTIYCYNGNIIVEEDGIIVSGRYGGAIVLNNNSTLTLKGSVVTMDLTANNSRVRAYPGSVMILGFNPGELNDGTAYGKAYFRNNSGTYLDSLGTCRTDSAGVGGTLTLNASSFESEGLVFIPAHGKMVTTNSQYSFQRSWNVYADIASMMLYW